MLFAWMKAAVNSIKKTCESLLQVSENFARTNSVLSYLCFIIIIAGLYIITGYTGLFFAIPPGYATPIWIPSGIALGATLIWGLRTLPGVFIGSLITNYLTTLRFDTTTSDYIPILIGIVIGLGAVLQTYAGWWMIRKLIGPTFSLIQPNEILLFAFLSGPVSCLVNTSWSNTGLLVLQVLPASNYLLSWTTWWIGDSIGVLIFTPIFLIFFAKPTHLWRQRMLFILFPLCITFAVSSLVYYFMYSIELKRIQSAFERRASFDMVEIESKITDFLSNQTPRAFMTSPIIKQALIGSKKNYYAIEIHATSDPRELPLIYAGFNERLKPTSKDYFLKYTQIFDAHSYQWQVSLTASSSYINNHFSWRLWFLLASSLMLCVLMNIILFIIYGQKILVQEEVEKKSTALEKSQFRNLLILRSAGEGIYGLDTQGHLTFFNPAAERMLGYKEEELLGKSMHEILHHSYVDGKDYPKEECPIYLAFKYNKIFRITDEIFWRKDKTCFWVEYTASPIKEGDVTTGAVVVFNDITQRRITENELRRLAFCDILTDLPNRVAFNKHLNKAIVQCKKDNRILAVCFLDMDNFKQINDNLGHTIGDEIIIVLARLLKSTLDPDDFVARLGGDEFAIIIDRLQTDEDIITTINQLLNSTQKTVNILDMEINISTSIGVAIYPHAGTETEELSKNADIALYHAKDSGKGRYAFFDEEINKTIRRRHQLDTQMLHAIDRGEFSLVYQLQVDAQTLEPVGCEALLRWNNEEFGPISPYEFIAVAEANGMIHQLGAWVLQKACHDFVNVLHQINNKFTLSINLSVIQLENVKFINMLQKTLEETKMDSERLLLEITETALINNPEHTVDVMSKIRMLGIRFALDDFGVSYSSMKYLKDLPISYIKIDQSFVRDISRSKANVNIVNAIIQLGHGVGLQLIAEGVENNEQFQLLKKMGCEYIQGFYFSKPLPVSELSKLGFIKSK